MSKLEDKENTVPKGGDCPQCGGPLVEPRGGEPYCEDCGYPDEDLVEKMEGFLVVNPEDECVFALIVALTGEDSGYAYYAIDDETNRLIGAGNGDTRGEVVGNAIRLVEGYSREVPDAGAPSPAPTVYYRGEPLALEDLEKRLTSQGLDHQEYCDHTVQDLVSAVVFLLEERRRLQAPGGVS